jgi:hypothetical protein
MQKLVLEDQCDHLSPRNPLATGSARDVFDEPTELPVRYRRVSARDDDRGRRRLKLALEQDLIDEVHDITQQISFRAFDQCQEGAMMPCSA